MGFVFWLRVWGIEANVVCNFVYWQVMARWWMTKIKVIRRNFFLLCFVLERDCERVKDEEKSKMEDFCCFVLCIKKSWWNITSDIHNWGTKKDGLTKKILQKNILDFYYIYNVVIIMDWCMTIILYIKANVVSVCLCVRHRFCRHGSTC
jgi:hypothetical protein